MSIVLVDIHMNFVDEPTYELVRVMMLIIIEKSIAGSYSGDEPFVVDHSPCTFRIQHVFEKLMKLIYQIILLFVARLPQEHLLSERKAVKQHLNGGICVTNV